jgi:hypothetical protein
MHNDCAYKLALSQTQVTPGQINLCLYTSDITKYKGAFVLCKVTCVQVKVNLLWCNTQVAACQLGALQKAFLVVIEYLAMAVGSLLISQLGPSSW